MHHVPSAPSKPRLPAMKMHRIHMSRHFINPLTVSWSKSSCPRHDQKIAQCIKSVVAELTAAGLSIHGQHHSKIMLPTCEFFGSKLQVSLNDPDSNRCGHCRISVSFCYCVPCWLVGTRMIKLGADLERPETGVSGQYGILLLRSINKSQNMLKNGCEEYGSVAWVLVLDECASKDSLWQLLLEFSYHGTIQGGFMHRWRMRTLPLRMSGGNTSFLAEPILPEGEEPAEWKQVAVKVASSSKMPEFGNEARLLSRLQHPNILRLRGAFYMDLDNMSVKDEVGRIPGCMFWACNNLADLVVVTSSYEANSYYERALHTGITEKQALHATQAVLQALTYMHGVKVIHTNLRCNAIVISQEGTVMVADFGFSTELQQDGAHIQFYAGFPSFAAPEQVAPNCCYGVPADVFAVGSCLYFMIAGHVAYRGSDREQIVESTLACKPNYNLPKIEPLRAETKRFMQLLMQLAPQRRPTAAEALRMVQGLNSENPSKEFHHALGQFFFKQSATMRGLHSVTRFLKLPMPVKRAQLRRLSTAVVSMVPSRLSSRRRSSSASSGVRHFDSVLSAPGGELNLPPPPPAPAAERANKPTAGDVSHTPHEANGPAAVDVPGTPMQEKERRQGDADGGCPGPSEAGTPVTIQKGSRQLPPRGRSPRLLQAPPPTSVVLTRQRAPNPRGAARASTS